MVKARQGESCAVASASSHSHPQRQRSRGGPGCTFRYGSADKATSWHIMTRAPCRSTEMSDSEARRIRSILARSKASSSLHGGGSASIIQSGTDGSRRASSNPSASLISTLLRKSEASGSLPRPPSSSSSRKPQSGGPSPPPPPGPPTQEQLQLRDAFIEKILAKYQGSIRTGTGLSSRTLSIDLYASPIAALTLRSH
jgi:hypothetical protein